MICIIAILFSINIPVRAAGGGGEQTGVLKIDYDDATPIHQALTMTVDSIASVSPIQAFCVGWNFTFSNLNGSISVYVPLSQIDIDGGNRTYTFPITTGWTLGFTGIKGGKSIRDLVSNKTLFDKIIKSGCTVHADARIRKYSYTNGTFTPLNTYANSKTEIDSNFSEFTSTFKTNTKNDYFDLSLTLAAEPIPVPNPSIILNLPEDGSTVLQGTTVTFKGFGTGVHHIAGLVDGKMYGVEQLNPNEDITTQMKYETMVKLDEVRDYTFQIKGRNTALSTDDGSELAVSAIHTVHVIAPAPNTGNINIKCLDYATNTVISSSLLSSVFYGTTTVSAPPVEGYSAAKGSYSTYTYSSRAPLTSSMQSGIKTQSVTLSESNKAVYVYFWYDKKEEIKGPVAIIDGPTQVRAGDNFTLSGSRSYCKLSGSKIVSYKWSVPIEGVSGETQLSSPGIHTINLTVTDNNGLSASTTHDIEVTPPIPTASFSLAGKIKENRKITVDARASDTPNNYPINWSKTKWKLEPDLSTGATWEMGVRLLDGTVIKINETTDQAFLNGVETFYFQARYAGKYKVKLYVENSYPASDTLSGLISVAKDFAPIADCNTQAENLREYNNPVDSTKRKYGASPITDASYSPDGDLIIKRTWCYRYNSNNNHASAEKDIYTDDITHYKYEGSLTTLFLPEEAQRLVVENDNDTTVELWSYDVGDYRFQLLVEESIPDDETISQLLLSTDIRSSTLKEW